MSKHNLIENKQKEDDRIAKIQKGLWQPSIILLQDEIARAVEAINGHSSSLAINGYVFGNSRTYAEIAFQGQVHRPIHESEIEIHLGRFLFDGRAISRIEALTHFLKPEGNTLYAIKNHQSVELWAPESYLSIYPSPSIAHIKSPKRQISQSVQIAESAQPAR